MINYIYVFIVQNNMSKEIMVSICCLAYNHEKYIRKTLEGFVNQITDFDCEILIHDDCSTDNTVEIIKEYERNYPKIIKPIYQKENQYSKGIAVSNIFQFPRAKGKYIAMCEGDDYWCDKYKLQKQLDALENNPNCSICTHIVQHIDEAGKTVNYNQPNSSLNLLLNEGVILSSEIFKSILKKTIIPFQTSCYFFKREYIIKYLNTFSKELDFLNFGDVPLIWYLFIQGDCYYINRTMSCYRENSIGSWSRSHAKIDNLIKHYEQLVIFFEIFNKFTDNKYDSLIVFLIEKYNYKILELNKEYRSMINKKNRLFFKDNSIKYKIIIYLCAYFPKLGNIYSHIKSRRKR